MPLTIDFEALILAGAEDLLPEDVRAGFALCCEVPADGAPKGQLADLLAEKYGEAELAALFRWFCQKQKFPERREWGWYWAHPWSSDSAEHAKLDGVLAVKVSDDSDRSCWVLVAKLLRDIRAVRAMLPG